MSLIGGMNVALRGRDWKTVLFIKLIIESVDSISRDGPDMPYM